ncbi:DUF2818 family protein [Sphaerotilus sulfidivorans]|uniref:DUF2818 family protein n=1 Tax=Sphaerotilus TaxID=34102 RepID=UPI001C7EB5B5|nr:DUF2818 family protein [Sphaerotilus sp. FB-3]GIX52839.1 hypothetical protein CQA4T8M7_20950 [Sphaerotilus natans]GKQ58111.1 hypothetical protein QMTAC487_19710 [Sphaerotilus sp. FB-3]
MSSSASIWLVLLLAAVLANLPFITERLLAFGPLRAPKSLAWRLLELLLHTGIVILVGRLLESRAGQMVPQGWQFYAVLLCLMLTLAFPGFVWRYLRRQR